MAAGDPEIIILSSSDEESKPQSITPQVTMQFSKRQKKSGYPAAQVKSVPQAQLRCSSRSQAVNITKQPMMSKNRTKIITVPAHKNQNVVVNKKIPQLSPNSAKSKAYYSSQQLQSVKLVKPQKNFDITKSVLSTQNFSSKNNVVSKISSQPVMRISTPKPSNQNEPVLKFGSNLSITSKSAEVRPQSSHKTTVSPSVISALKKKGISVTNVYENDISDVRIPKKSASSQNDLNDLRNKLLKSNINIDVVPKTNNASSDGNTALNSYKPPQVSTQGLKRKYSNLDAVGPSSAPSAKKVANYSNHNLVNPSSAEHIKKIISSSKNLSINPVKNIPLKNDSQIKVVQRPVMLSNSSKKPPNGVHHNSQIANSKNNCFVPKTYMKHPEKALSSSSLLQTTSKRQVSIIPTKSSQSNLVKENLDTKNQSSLVNNKKSIVNLEATDLKNNLAKKVDSDLIVCYSSFPPSNRTVNPSRKSPRISNITKLPAPNVPDSQILLKQTTLPLKKTTLHNSIKQSRKTGCKKIDLSKDRKALLDLLALCDDTHSSSISKKTTSTRKPVKNHLNAALTIVPMIDNLLSSYKPMNNTIESMKLHEIKDRTRNWPKLVVLLEKLNLGMEYAYKNLSTEPIIQALDSNNEITIDKGQLTEEVNHPKPSCSQLSSNATESLVSCLNIKSVHRSVNTDVLTEGKGLQNPVILNNSQQSCGSVTIPLNEPVDKCSVLACLLTADLSTAERINLSDSNHKPPNENSQLSKELKSSNSNASQLSTNIINEQVECSNIKTTLQAVDNSGCLVKVQNKKLENIIVFESIYQNKNSDTNSLNMHTDKDANKILSTSAASEQDECSVIKEMLLQPVDIDLAKDKHLLNCVVSDSTLQSKQSDANIINSQVDSDTNKSISMKPIIKTVYLSDSGCDKKMQKELKSVKEIQMNLELHTDLNNIQLLHPLTYNQVESSDLKSTQQGFDMNDSSKIKETDFQNSHQSNGCATDLNKHKDTCVDKKLLNQLVVKVLNLSDSDSKLDTEKVQENVELEPSNDIELSASVTNSPTEFSNANTIQQDVDNVIALPNAEEAKLCMLRKHLEANLSNSDSKLDNEMVGINEEFVSSNEIELSANVTNSTIACSNVNPIQKAVDNVIALPWYGEVSDINGPNLMISENSQSNCCVANTLEETDDSSHLKSNNNNVVNSSSRDNICKMVNSPITSVISSDSSSFSLNEDIKMTLIDRPQNLSYSETLDTSDVDYDLVDKSANNTTKSLDEKKGSEFSEVVKQPSLISSLSPDASDMDDLSYNSASVIVKNLLRVIISNVEELNSKNNSMRSNELKVTEDSNSVVPNCETEKKVCKKSVTDSVKSKSEEVAEEKESGISNCILDPVYSKCFVIGNTLEKEINDMKLHSNEDLFVGLSTSKQPDSENKNIVDQDCKKPLCSNIASDSQLNITAAAFFPCTEAVEKSCSEALFNSADDESNECDIKIVSVMSTARSNVTNDVNEFSVASPLSSGETNDDLNYKLRETKSSTADEDKGMTADDETKSELSDQFKNNVMSEFENDKMGSSKHILDFHDDSNISGPLHADEGSSCAVANVESNRATVVEKEQNFDLTDESEFRENLFNDDNDYESMDSDDQVIATGLKSLSSEESASNIFAPAVTDDEKQTLNQSNSTQVVTSPKLSLKRNRNIESPNHVVEEKDSVKRIKLLDSSLSSDVIHEQSSSNFSIVPFNINTDEKNKKRFMELLEFSKTLMEETSEIEKEKIVKIMLKKLNETELWYAGSEKFSNLIDKTLVTLTDPNENVFSVLQGVRKEFKKYKCKFKPTFIKENNTDTNSGGSFLPIKISSVEGNTDSSSLTDIRYRPKKRPSLLDEETRNFSNLKNSVNGFTLNSVSSLSQIDSLLPKKNSESSCNNHEIESDLQSTSFHSALQETLRNLDCTADKAILDLKSVSLASSSQNFKAEEKAPSVLQEHLPSKSLVPAVCNERTSDRNLCASPSFQSHSTVLDSSKPCLTTDKKEVKLFSSVESSNFEPLPSCSYHVDSNSSSSLQNLSSERTSNKKPDWEGGTSLSLSSCIPVDKINDTLSVLNKEKSIKEIIHEPEDSRQQRRIKKLEKLLEQLDKKIKKLQEKELSLDDLDNEESAYILEDKYVRRFKQAWDTLCKLKKQPSRTGRIVEKKFKYEGTRFKEINTGIEKMINKRKAHEKFPDFVEVLTLIKNVNDVHDIGLNERAIHIEAERVFKDIGRELQIRRMRDHEELFGCHLTDGMDLNNDPAEHNEELKKVLRANSHKFEESINKVIDSYAEKQKKMPEEKDNQDDKNTSDEEDADEVEEVDKEDLPLTDPGSDTSGSDKKTKNDIVEIIYDSDKSTDPNEELKTKEKAKPEQQTTVNKSNVVLDVIDLGHDSDSMGELPSIQELMSSR